MARPEKVAVVDEIKEKLESSQGVFVTEYRGLTVGQQQELRRSLRKADAEYKVMKMSLARLAAEAAGLTDILPWLEGPTAIAFTEADPVLAAKSLKQFADTNEFLVLKGGLLAGDTLDADAVRRLAEIEPRDVLLARLAGAMAGPMSKLAGLMSAVLRQPASAMQQLLEKMEAEAPAGGTEGSTAEEVADDGSGEVPTPEEANGEAAVEESDDAVDDGEAPGEKASSEPPVEDTGELTAKTDVEADPAAEAAEKTAAEEVDAAPQDDPEDSE